LVDDNFIFASFFSFLVLCGWEMNTKSKNRPSFAWLFPGNFSESFFFAFIYLFIYLFDTTNLEFDMRFLDI
jgi:hypothetical protein